MTVDELKYLTDIKTAIQGIDDHMQGKRDFDVFNNNKTIKRAVERELSIIGEAVSRLIKLNPEISLSYKRLIVDLRNKVVHAYDTIDEVIVWKIVMKDVPILLQEVELLLKK